jgi:hypothetical protein
MSVVEVLQPPRQSGLPGASAYQIAVQGGYQGTQAQWLASLVGPAADPTALNAAVTLASTSATNALNRSADAASSAGAASVSASSAAGSATSSSSSATGAANSAAGSSASATASANSATASSTSATLSQAWATQTTGTVDGTRYSSYYWAQQAALSASQAAGNGVQPSGTFIAGHFLVVNNTAGTQAIDGGVVGSISHQNASAVAITGGTIDGTAIGSTTPASGSFTAITTATALGVAYGGTGTTTSTGTGSVVLSTSPTLTGIPIVPTAAAGTSTGQAASTAFVAAAVAAIPPTYPVTGTSTKSTAYTLGSTGGDTGKVFILTGSFALTLPLASGGSAASPLYYHYSKRDGSGVCTLVLSGSDTWEDGTTAPKFVYQENGTLVSIGGGVWRFAPGTRQRGKVFAGTFSITAGASALAITLGFGDPDAQNVIAEFSALTVSATATITYAFTQGGTAATLTGSTPVGGLTGSATTGPHSGAITVRNVRSTAANGVSTQANGITGTSATNAFAHVSSSGAVTQMSVTPSGGATFTGGATGGSYTVCIERP